MPFSRIFVILGVAFILLGLLFPVAMRLNLGRLPGDIMIKKENFTFYFPLATGIVISIVLTVVVKVYQYFFR
ncbi:MAG: DUF2905 domain-containing protein [Firmicutes bacterium]|nr:DUF2905 domain-containing protein [Bacillota bacterium]